MKQEYPLRVLCQVLEVSASGYYDWRRRQIQPGPRAQANAQLQALIRQLHQASRQTYGSPRLQQQLARQGHRHGRNRIARLMRQARICGRTRRRFRVCTTDSQHDQPIAPNWLATLPAPAAPNQVWVGDITYVATGEGWLYVAAVLDLYSRRLTGLAMSQQLDTPLVLEAWNMALTHRQPPPGLVFHSDRGVQYASLGFRQALHQAQTVASMSRKGNCYDNAAMESFWSTLKNELIHRRQFATRAQASQAIFEFVEVFYNRQRLHSALDFLSPVDFENNNN